MAWTSTTFWGNETPTSQKEVGELNISEQLGRINHERSRLAELEGSLLEKGLQSYNPDVLLKAQSYWNDIQQRQSSDAKSVTIDPREFSDSLGFKEKTLSVSFDLLRRMSRTPIIRSIIGTRQAQVSAFSNPQPDRFSTGFVVRKKREFYTTEEPKLTKQDKIKIHEITKFLLNGGDASNAWHGDSFDSFLKKIVDDALALDQATFEVVRNAKGEPVEFLATDGSTFRIAATFDDDQYKNTKKIAKMGYYPSYVQIIEGEVENEYYPWEMCLGIRNHSSDIYRNGYGRSELEDLVEIVTYMLSADTYNGKFFTQGSNPKGIIKLAGNVNTNRISEFRQQWQSMIAGTMNAWKIPILESDKMEWIDLQKNNTDMQFSTWQEYLLKICCSIYKISPEELGFPVSTGGGGGGLFESGTEARLMYSRDKGLIPLLKSIEFWINKWIVEPKDEDFEFAFVGYDQEGKEKELDLDIKLVGSFVGWKEMRRKWNYSEDLEEGDFPLNSVWVQRTGALEMQQQSQENDQAMQGDDEDTWNNLDSDQNNSDEGDAPDDIWGSLDKGISANPMTNDLIEFWNSLKEG